jgi:hypothetical protein
MDILALLNGYTIGGKSVIVMATVNTGKVVLMCQSLNRPEGRREEKIGKNDRRKSREGEVVIEQEKGAGGVE